jgi:hypothetical protein
MKTRTSGKNRKFKTINNFGEKRQKMAENDTEMFKNV